MTSETVTPYSPVTDNEVLYRAVLNEPRFFPKDSQGGHRISSMAFNDAGRRPSVDRAVLCPNGPADTRQRFRSDSRILSVITGDVRQLTTVHGGTGQAYTVDVEPIPLDENPAHAEIFGRPPFDTDKIFDRIKQALSRIATESVLTGEEEAR